MELLIFSILILLMSGCLALLFYRRPQLGASIGIVGTVLASLMGIIPTIRVLGGFPPLDFSFPWEMPGGSLHVGLDGLSAFFLLPLFMLSPLAALYGSEYLKNSASPARISASWFFFNLLIASMILVVTARNGLLFLLAWEIMSLASFFLVCYEFEKNEVLRAGWTYLVATHLGAVFLLVFFLDLHRWAGSLEFSAFSALHPASGAASLLFLLALVGFGTKAGFFPLHVWLPQAHPAAPSHVSALMSGIMIKMGIYGILRTLTWLGPYQSWWAFTLIGIGVISGLAGVLLALGQHDLKRLLAYHSVENIGIITLGLGLGMLGVVMNMPMMAVLGFAGGLLHVLNHAIFKGLLFLCAGAVLHATHKRKIDQLGGLIRRMPITGATFLVGAAAISGLPPLNGFVSEFLLYLGAFHSLLGATPALIAAVIVIAGLALIGGLAAACFTKAFGIAFLGEPRQAGIETAHDPGLAMRLPLMLLAFLCFLIGMGFWLILPALTSPVATLSQVSTEKLQEIFIHVRSTTLGITAGTFFLLFLLGAFLWLRARLQRQRILRRAVTWDCGYIQPSSRMQYTASSFAQPIIDFFGIFLFPRKQTQPIDGYFPSNSQFHARLTDLPHEFVYAPSFKAVEWLLSKLRWLQGGRVNVYILYIALTLAILLLWKLL